MGKSSPSPSLAGGMPSVSAKRWRPVQGLARRQHAPGALQGYRPREGIGSAQAEQLLEPPGLSLSLHCWAQGSIQLQALGSSEPKDSRQVVHR